MITIMILDVVIIIVVVVSVVAFVRSAVEGVLPTLLLLPGGDIAFVPDSSSGGGPPVGTSSLLLEHVLTVSFNPEAEPSVSFFVSFVEMDIVSPVSVSELVDGSEHRSCVRSSDCQAPTLFPFERVGFVPVSVSFVWLCDTKFVEDCPDSTVNPCVILELILKLLFLLVVTISPAGLTDEKQVVLVAWSAYFLLSLLCDGSLILFAKGLEGRLVFRLACRSKR